MSCRWFVILFFISLSSQGQWMKPEDKHTMGVRAGVSVGWLLNPEISSRNNLSRYQPVPRQGISVGMYSKSRLTRFIHGLNPRTDVKNWYFQMEFGCAFRGGNYRFYNAVVDTAGKPITDKGVNQFIRSDTGDFRKISNFVIEMPMLVVWDIGNKNKSQILFGGGLQYIAFCEMFRGNDYSPLYVGNALPTNYWNLIKIQRIGFNAMMGFQLSGEYAGFQCMVRYGLTNQNLGIVTKLNPQTFKPERIMPGPLNPLSIDFSVTF